MYLSLSSFYFIYYKVAIRGCLSKKVVWHIHHRAGVLKLNNPVSFLIEFTSPIVHRYYCNSSTYMLVEPPTVNNKMNLSISHWPRKLLDDNLYFCVDIFKCSRFPTESPSAVHWWKETGRKRENFIPSPVWCRISAVSVCVFGCLILSSLVNTSDCRDSISNQKTQDKQKNINKNRRGWLAFHTCTKVSKQKKNSSSHRRDLNATQYILRIEFRVFLLFRSRTSANNNQKSRWFLPFIQMIEFRCLYA